MALAQSHFVLAVVLRDVAGKEITKRYRLTAALPADAVTEGIALAGLLASLTDCVIPQVDIITVYTDTVGNGTAPWFNQAQITARLVTEGKSVNFNIPAAKAGIFRGASGVDYNIVDTTDADVIAFLSEFEAAGTASVSDGEYIRDAATSGNWAGARLSKGSKAAPVTL